MKLFGFTFLPWITQSLNDERIIGEMKPIHCSDLASSQRKSAKISMLIGNLNMILAMISKILEAFFCKNGAAREVEFSCKSDCSNSK